MLNFDSCSAKHLSRLYIKDKIGGEIVGEPEIQKLEKSGRKVAEFLTIPSVTMVFQKCENRYCTNFKSCKRCLFMGLP